MSPARTSNAQIMWIHFTFTSGLQQKQNGKCWGTWPHSIKKAVKEMVNLSSSGELSCCINRSNYPSVSGDAGEAAQASRSTPPARRWMAAPAPLQPCHTAPGTGLRVFYSANSANPEITSSAPLMQLVSYCLDTFHHGNNTCIVKHACTYWRRWGFCHIALPFV